jgi:hypothetical protein
MGAQSALAGSLIGQRNKALCQLGHQIALFLHTYFLIFNSIFKRLSSVARSFFDKSLSSFLMYRVNSQNSNPRTQ